MRFFIIRIFLHSFPKILWTKPKGVPKSSPIKILNHNHLFSSGLLRSRGSVPAGSWKWYCKDHRITYQDTTLTILIFLKKWMFRSCTYPQYNRVPDTAHFLLGISLQLSISWQHIGIIYFYPRCSQNCGQEWRADQKRKYQSQHWIQHQYKIPEQR